MLTAAERDRLRVSPPAIETEADWLSCTDPYRMFTFLCPQHNREQGDRAGDWVTDRRLLLWCHACALAESDTKARRSTLDQFERGGFPGSGFEGMALIWARTQNGDPSPEVKCHLFREIFQPFRRYAWTEIHNCRPSGHELQFLDRRWLTWQGGTISRLAQHMYDERNFADVGVLADALEEAGAPPDSEIVMHFRGQARCPACQGTCGFQANSTWVPCELCDPDYPDVPSTCTPGWVPKPVGCVRGCWATDLLLGYQ